MLEGKVALITGASQGLGRALALAFAREGASIVINSRSEESIRPVAREAEALGAEVVALAADVSRNTDAERLVDTAVERFGRVDVLVNNAGAVLRKDTEELTAAELDTLWAVNVRSVLLLCRAVLPAMVRGGGGSIVNVSSISAVRGTPRRAAYAATKAALDGMTRSLAMEYGPRGVRVNSIAPGAIETDMWRTPLAQDGVREHVEGHVALRRVGVADDIAPVVVFLASDAARYITGETLSVDGGMHATMNLYPTV
jgi:NAD(P)-dependent dehydrogenase (short-subunit alcohol dehydrogenase family)